MTSLRCHFLSWALWCFLTVHRLLVLSRRKVLYIMMYSLCIAFQVNDANTQGITNTGTRARTHSRTHTYIHLNLKKKKKISRVVTKKYTNSFLYQCLYYRLRSDASRPSIFRMFPQHIYVRSKKKKEKRCCPACNWYEVCAREEVKLEKYVFLLTNFFFFLFW